MASKKNMSDYKTLTHRLYPPPRRVQELIPVYKIGEDGVFLLEDLPDGTKKLFDKAYLFEDANFATMDDYEKDSALKRYGFDHYVHWEVSETKNMEKALEDIQPGSILLFHSKKKDTHFLEQLIPVLQEQGYEMVTLSELFGFDPPETGEELYVYDRKNYEDK